MANCGSPGLAKRLEIERRRIASQHEKLGELWQSFLEPFRKHLAEGARDAFSALRDGLAAHFELEEKVQIPALHGADPAIRPQLEQLVLEHRELSRGLKEILLELDAGRLEHVEERVEWLIQLIAEHEAREEDLFRPL